MQLSSRTHQAITLLIAAGVSTSLILSTGCSDKRVKPTKKAIPCDGSPCQPGPAPGPSPTPPPQNVVPTATAPQIQAGNIAFAAGSNNGFDTLTTSQIDDVQACLTPQAQVDLLQRLTPNEAAGFLRNSTSAQRLQFATIVGPGGVLSALSNISPAQLSRFQAAVTAQEWQTYQDELASGGYASP